ncbi:MAG: tRNA (adenosine(37)-N6)-threonylcarbamoyltransferase complex dimerization subunit type 1 TsaB [Candidatus Rokuibacteriota bacterium]
MPRRVLHWPDMRVLALDTSTLAGGVALVDGERTVAECLLDIRLTHSERLMPAVDQLLRGAGWGPPDLEGVAVAGGPGSFTGLRIGVSAAKGFALALSIPVAVVPTLDAMAAALPFAQWPVCPVLVARRDEVYVSLYRWDGTAMRREWDYLALPPSAVSERLRERVILTGDGATTIASPLAVLAPCWRWAPSAAIVGHLGAQRLRAGASVGAAELAPLYVRPPHAELTHRARALS